MSSKAQQYTGRLYTQPEVDRMLREARQRVQKCPVCDGTGVTNRGGYLNTTTCHVCLGAFILTKERIAELSKDDV